MFPSLKHPEMVDLATCSPATFEALILLPSPSPVPSGQLSLAEHHGALPPAPWPDVQPSADVQRLSDVGADDFSITEEELLWLTSLDERQLPSTPQDPAPLAADSQQTQPAAHSRDDSLSGAETNAARHDVSFIKMLESSPAAPQLPIDIPLPDDAQRCTNAHDCWAVTESPFAVGTLVWLPNRSHISICITMYRMTLVTEARLHASGPDASDATVGAAVQQHTQEDQAFLEQLCSWGGEISSHSGLPRLALDLPTTLRKLLPWGVWWHFGSVKHWSIGASGCSAASLIKRRLASAAPTPRAFEAFGFLGSTAQSCRRGNSLPPAAGKAAKKRGRRPATKSAFQRDIEVMTLIQTGLKPAGKERADELMLAACMMHNVLSSSRSE